MRACRVPSPPGPERLRCRLIPIHPTRGGPIQAQTTSSSAPKPNLPADRTFFVGGDARPQAVIGRPAAVERARALSRKTWKPVRAVRKDERVELVFQRGELLNYRYTGNR